MRKALDIDNVSIKLMRLEFMNKLTILDEYNYKLNNGDENYKNAVNSLVRELLDDYAYYVKSGGNGYIQHEMRIRGLI